MTKNLLPITLLSLALCSCASLEEQNKAFADYANKVLPPLKPSPQASQVAQQSQSGQAELKEICKKGVVVGPSDVDTAYVRAMRAIGFDTPEDKQRKGLWLADNYRHTVTPGVMYDLWDSTDMTYTDGTLRGATVGIRLTKEGSGSAAEYRYCALEREGPGFFAFMDSQFPSIVGAVATSKPSATNKTTSTAKAKK
ncbi:hypothetical protein OPU71_18660 [Niveibacterium sp. 24ML]|uniref:hypothetical protein n=1 Tax=Niveibacterium sp. 24ML TaxID=2985512 RepID=UPI00227107E9|nr:hypothetical protein [Niveibacterium sp. 24ML]MCX9158149.1 hypothetical protein [Niveibacterium sp. 24ML]